MMNYMVPVMGWIIFVNYLSNYIVGFVMAPLSAPCTSLANLANTPVV